MKIIGKLCLLIASIFVIFGFLNLAVGLSPGMQNDSVNFGPFACLILIIFAIPFLVIGLWLRGKDTEKLKNKSQ